MKAMTWKQYWEMVDGGDWTELPSMAGRDHEMLAIGDEVYGPFDASDDGLIEFLESQYVKDAVRRIVDEWWYNDDEAVLDGVVIKRWGLRCNEQGTEAKLSGDEDDIALQVKMLAA